MDLPHPASPCTDYLEPTVFIRHHRMLRAVMIGAQAWFPLSDLARLMGKRLDERSTLKLDADQSRTAWLQTHQQWERCLLLSESAVFAMLVHHYVPENRALRQWLVQDVLPALHARHREDFDHPESCQMRWQGRPLSTLQWHDDLWIRLRDVPELVQVQTASHSAPIKDPWWKRLMTQSARFRA
ncbi:BRO-N domain-containing protein [Pseudomonas viridiflava]|uniref:BRO-N domain-containing protein n=1 Tax=Pseudomonas viridiflava TaxID=33069 RepID=UPI000F03A55E|nr:Bro-N domain-containing protein [Pseudomonas viridiflava]MEE4126851.1 Bro-N domain-containing protein [Pseudomonas viridiflava]